MNFSPLKTAVRKFSSSSISRINRGDKLPSIPLFESSPGNKVSLSNYLPSSSKSVIVGVPGAFSPGCTASHIPGYISELENFKQKGYGKIVVVAVNDPFVMKAWKESLEAPEEIGFLADSTGDFVNELELSFDAEAIFGNSRSKRFALLVNEDGTVDNMFVEPDNVGINVSKAEKVLEKA